MEWNNNTNTEEGKKGKKKHIEQAEKTEVT